MMRSSDLSVGEKVMAKWPGSSKYYEAIVKSVGSSTKSGKQINCTVEFVGQTDFEADVKASDIYVSVQIIASPHSNNYKIQHVIHDSGVNDILKRNDVASYH